MAFQSLWYYENWYTEYIYIIMESQETNQEKTAAV